MATTPAEFTRIQPFFEVDRAGLAQRLERRGTAFAVGELWQNARDEDGVTEVSILLEPVAGRPLVTLAVTDDSPDGWRSLRDAYTLFAPSYKKNDVTKAGRFNLGEKLVLALCDEATIATTTGTLVFDRDGRKHYPRRKRKRGSEFHGLIRMTRAEMAEATALVRSLFVPEHISLTLNGTPIPSRQPVASFIATLATEIADDDGILRPTRRMTEVNVYEIHGAETATLYELGIPVVETGDRWHVSVEQKVPVSLDRTGLVTLGYLRDIRALVLNEMAEELSGDEAAERWVDHALEDEAVEPAAVEAILTERYGDRRVVYDPSDHEANRTAAANGYTVIPGAAFSKAAWANVRRAGAAQPAGQVHPTPRPFVDGAPALRLVAEWTDVHYALARYFQTFAKATIGKVPTINFADDPGWKFGASYGDSGLVWNVRRAPMERGPRMDDLLIHELAHEDGGHLSAEYDRALSRIGAYAMDAIRNGRL